MTLRNNELSINPLNYKYGLMMAAKKHSISYDSDDNTFNLFAKILSRINHLRHLFPGITIPNVKPKQKFGFIFYSSEKQRDPIIFYLKTKISTNFVVRHSHQIIDSLH